MFSSPIMILMNTNDVVDHEKLRRAVNDIHQKGFDTVCMEFRNCIYDEYDIQGKAAMKVVVEECKKIGLKVIKIIPMPGHNIVKKYPKARQMWVVEHQGTISDNKITISIKKVDANGTANTEPTFQGILKAFLVQRDKGLIISTEDITSRLQYSINLDVTPTVTGTCDKNGEVLLFAAYQTDCMDFAFTDIYESIDDAILQYENLPLDGYALDEFGAGSRVCDVYLAGGYFLKEFKTKYGYELLDKLYLLKNQAVGESSGKVRFDYYQLTMEHTYKIQKYVNDRYKELFGKEVFAGFHNTWWGEGNSGDLWAGNIDYFKLTETLSGGFVDAQYDAERTMVSMSMLAESLAKFSESGIAYNMCWDRNPTHGKMDYFHRLLAVRNVRWVGHAYGKSSGFGPGYPDHPTWEDTITCNHREKIFQEFIGNAVTKPKVAMMYLWESVACLNNESMHYHRLSMKALLHKMLQNNIEIDVVPTFDNELERFDVLIVLWPSMMLESTWKTLKAYAATGRRIVFMGPPAQCTVEGHDIIKEFEELTGASAGGGLSNKIYNGEYEYVAWDLWFTDTKIPMLCYPLAPTDSHIQLLHETDVLGVSKKNVEYYSFEMPLTTYFDPFMNSLQEYCELELPDAILSKVSYEGETSVVTLTGQWGSKINTSFTFKGNSITIKNGNLVGIKLKGNSIEQVISEKGSNIEINNKRYDYIVI